MTPAERELRDRVDALERENASLRARLEQALAENERLRLRISVVFDGQNAPDIHGQRWTASSLPHIA